MIYLDNAATTCPDQRVVDYMAEISKEFYFNPSSSYTAACRSRSLINKARGRIASLIGADSSEIYFTSGGTEADVWAIRGLYDSYLIKDGSPKGFHIISDQIEHPAVLNTCRAIEKLGAEVTLLKPDPEGYISPEAAAAAIRSNTRMISVMMVNNEIGTIQNISEIGRIAHEHGVLMHTDAVQAVGHIPIDVRTMNIDLLSSSGHKFYGPKGSGFLYIRSGLAINPLLSGGGQERGLRSGTEDTAAIAGLGLAAELAQTNMDAERVRVAALRDHLADRLLSGIEGIHINGAWNIPGRERIGSNLNISLDGVEGSSLLVNLDMRGICCSTGSACSASSDRPSHVLTALGLPESRIRGSIRLTLSGYTTAEEIDKAADIIIEESLKLRELRYL